MSKGYLIIKNDCIKKGRFLAKKSLKVGLVKIWGASKDSEFIPKISQTGARRQ
jgi:hypothetical protein